MKKTAAEPMIAIRRFFWQHHLTLFIALAAGSVAIAIYSLFGIILNSSNASTQSVSADTTFDQDTIKRVQALSDSPDDTYTLPTGQRTDPFTEK